MVLVPESIADVSERVGESEKVVVLPLGAESKKVLQAMSNDTARRILEVLAEESLSVSQISDLLEQPLTTVQYNVDKLLDAGLIQVERTRWSEKGREMKVYGAAQKLIVVVPQSLKGVDVSGILKKYVAAGIAATGVAAALEWLTRPQQEAAPMMEAARAPESAPSLPMVDVGVYPHLGL